MFYKQSDEMIPPPVRKNKYILLRTYSILSPIASTHTLYTLCWLKVKECIYNKAMTI